MISHVLRGYTLAGDTPEMRDGRRASQNHHRGPRARIGRRIRPVIAALTAAIALAGCRGVAPQRPSNPDGDPTPQSVEEFTAAAGRVLAETGVPGAGLALVRQDRVEWAGGAGYADRDRRTPVTADTHFRVGSISKSFVAMGLVQLYQDGRIDFESPVATVDPDIAIDNPWQATDPVKVIHILQHTAGLDDMHFADLYVPDGAPEVSLADALARNPRARRVRWRPGTRMSYSNVGYGIAGALLEKVAGEPYEDYIKHAIFDKIGMPTSSFRLSAADEATLAQGYSGPSGPPVGFPRIYLRPAGNLHTSPRELAQFVRLILNWGEESEHYVVDPEYLGNMEQPRTTLAAAAGLRNGYGSAIGSNLTLPYRVLGHDGGIDGFLSTYGYSPSRDVGYVVLLNSVGSHAPEALSRISSMAIRYLKRDIEPPAKPEVHLDAATLDRYVGYYAEANPRSQIVWALQSLFAGITIERDGESLYAVPFMGPRVRLIPVTETTFRREREIDASRVFTQEADGTPVLAGTDVFAEKRPRWRVELVRLPTIATAPLVGSVLIFAVAWAVHSRRASPRGFWGLKLALLLCPLLILTCVAALAFQSARTLGTINVGTIAVFLATAAMPVVTMAVVAAALQARRHGASRWLTSYAFLIAAAMAWISVYLGSYGLLGLRLWSY